MAVIDRLSIAVAANTTALNRALTKSALSIRSFATSAQSAGRGGVAALIGAFGSAVNAAIRLGTAIGTIGFAALGIAAFQAAKNIKNFGNAMAEVSTLVNESEASIDRLTEETLRLSETYGTDVVKQAEGLYQTISAGADASTEAIGELDVANKIAVAGLTDVDTAVDALSTVMNAFTVDTKDAIDVADALFVSVKEGKTRIEELAGGLQFGASTAGTLGVEYEQLLAAVSALTAAGTKTSRAFRQVNQIMNKVLNPTAESKELAKELGIEFNAAALEAKGFRKFLLDAAEAADFSAKKLSTLFPGTRTGPAVLALTGAQLGKFTEILEQMGNRAGTTEQAFEKMVNTLQFQFDLLKSAVDVTSTKIGDAMEEELIGAVKTIRKGITDGREDIVKFYDTLAADTTEFVNAIRERSGRLKDVFRPFINAFNAVISGLTNNSPQQAAESLVSGLESIQQRIKPITKFISDLFNTLRQNASRFVQTLNGVFSVIQSTNIFQNMRKNLESGGAQVGEVITGLFEKIGQKVIEFIGFIDKEWPEIKKIFKGPLTEAKDAFLSFLSAFNFEFFENQVIPFLSTIGGAIGTLISLFNSLSPETQEATAQLTGWGLVIKKLIDFVKPFIKLGKNFVSWLLSLVVAKKASSWIGQLANIFKSSGLRGLIEGVKIAAVLLVDKLAAWFPTIAKIITKVGGFVLSMHPVVRIILIVITVVSLLATIFKGDFGDAIDFVIGKLKGMWEWLKNIAGALAQGVADFILEVIAAPFGGVDTKTFNPNEVGKKGANTMIEEMKTEVALEEADRLRKARQQPDTAVPSPDLVSPVDAGEGVGGGFKQLPGGGPGGSGLQLSNRNEFNLSVNVENTTPPEEQVKEFKRRMQREAREVFGDSTRAGETVGLDFTI